MKKDDFVYARFVSCYLKKRKKTDEGVEKKMSHMKTPNTGAKAELTDDRSFVDDCFLLNVSEGATKEAGWRNN